MISVRLFAIVVINMPVIKSAKKRVKVSAKATIRNRRLKDEIKLSHKALKNAVLSSKKDEKEIQASLAKYHSLLDKAVKKKVIHKNKASRKKIRTNSQLEKIKAGQKTVKAKPTGKKSKN